jgi:hypothetical protein
MARRKAAPKPQAEAADTPAPHADDQSHTHPTDSTAPDFPFGTLAPAPLDTADAPPDGALQPTSPLPVAARSESKPGNRPHVRSWSRDLILGYQILTDDRLKLIVLRFDERPADAVLAMVKDMGFKYRELREHGRVWVTPNDWEGRTLTDQLEQELYRYRTGQERAGQGVT